jgi:hypothetical protein
MCATFLTDGSSVGDDSKSTSCDKTESRKTYPHQCEGWTYSRLVRLVLVWSATASSSTPPAPIELLERLLACGHEM